jgi:outer membrane lipoprotein-sorting protein
MKLLKFLSVCLVFAFCAAGARAQDVAPAEILRKTDAVRSPSPNFAFTVHLQSKTRSGQTESEFDVSVRESTKSLVLYRKPLKQRGRALLLDGPNMWIHIPGTNRPIRISAQQQLVGAVSNADVARVVFSIDYETERIEQVRASDTPALKLSLRAKQRTSSYQTIHLWVGERDYRPLKAEFFSLSGKLVRTIHYGGYKPVLGRLRPTVLEIADAINPSVSATLTFSDFEIKETPAEYYQPSYLGRLSH